MINFKNFKLFIITLMLMCIFYPDVASGRVLEKAIRWEGTGRHEHDGTTNTLTGGTKINTTNLEAPHTFQTDPDSATGLQVLDANGGEPVLVVNTIDESVGIGLNDPDYKLHIETGTIKVTGSGPVDYDTRKNALAFARDSTAVGLYENRVSFSISGIPADNTINFELCDGDSTTHTNVMTLRGDTRVGIGTEYPEELLHVYAGSAGLVAVGSTSPIVVENNDNAYLTFLTPNDKNSGIIFGDVDDNNIGSVIYDHVTDSIRIRTSDTPDRVIIDSSGKLGVNTTSPHDLLHVKGGTIKSAQSGCNSYANRTNALIFAQTSSAEDTYENLVSSSTSSTPSNAGIYFEIADSTSGHNTVLTVRGDERVGINTSTPDRRLDVRSDGTANDHMASFYNNTNTDGAYIYTSVGTDNTTGNSARYGYQNDTTPGDEAVWIGLYGDSHETLSLRVRKGGNVGIGVKNPDYKLHVVEPNGLYAGYFTHNLAESGGAAVYGVSTNTTGDGVFGVCNAANGRGVHGRGAAYDFYADGAGTDYGPFTGGHEVILSKNVPEDIKPGMLMSMTGEVKVRGSKDHKTSISSTLPTVKLSDVSMDKAVLGVFTQLAPLHNEHWSYGKNDARLAASVNALGEGRAWVSNKGGDLEVGDYVTTSEIPGYGKEQLDDIQHSYTLGKVTEYVDWGTVVDTVSFKDVYYKVYLIGVIYTSG